jgi:hypothetical protein
VPLKDHSLRWSAVSPEVFALQDDLQAGQARYDGVDATTTGAPGVRGRPQGSGDDLVDGALGGGEEFGLNDHSAADAGLFVLAWLLSERGCPDEDQK